MAVHGERKVTNIAHTATHDNDEGKSTHGKRTQKVPGVLSHTDMIGFSVAIPSALMAAVKNSIRMFSVRPMLTGRLPT